MGATHDQYQRNAGFAARDIRAGFVVCLPILVGVAAFGAVLWVLAGAKGVTLGELMAMATAPGSSPSDARWSPGCNASRRRPIIRRALTRRRGVPEAIEKYGLS